MPRRHSRAPAAFDPTPLTREEKSRKHLEHDKLCRFRTRQRKQRVKYQKQMAKAAVKPEKRPVKRKVTIEAPSSPERCCRNDAKKRRVTESPTTVKITFPQTPSAKYEETVECDDLFAGVFQDNKLENGEVYVMRFDEIKIVGVYFDSVHTEPFFVILAYFGGEEWFSTYAMGLARAYFIYKTKRDSGFWFPDIFCEDAKSVVLKSVRSLWTVGFKMEQKLLVKFPDLSAPETLRRTCQPENDFAMRHVTRIFNYQKSEIDGLRKIDTNNFWSFPILSLCARSCIDYVTYRLAEKCLKQCHDYSTSTTNVFEYVRKDAAEFWQCVLCELTPDERSHLFKCLMQDERLEDSVKKSLKIEVDKTMS